jgi:hypothetical protein
MKYQTLIPIISNIILDMLLLLFGGPRLPLYRRLPNLCSHHSALGAFLSLSLIGLSIAERPTARSLIRASPLADASLVPSEHETPETKRRHGSTTQETKHKGGLPRVVVSRPAVKGSRAMVQGGDEEDREGVGRYGVHGC